VSAVAELLAAHRPARGRPWDLGPEVTERDLLALAWVADQYAVRSDVLGVLLGRLSPAAPRRPGQLGGRTVRQRVERWAQAGWVERRRLLGHTWVLPTRAGLRLAGMPFDPWEPAAARLAHHHAAAVVRLAREPIPGQGGWVGERALWRRRGKASWHLADGALPASLPESWRAQGIGEAWELVEIELHQKSRHRVLAALKTRPPHTALVTYYAPPGLLRPLDGLLASVVRELGGRPHVRVECLPTLGGLAAGGAR
jgi:hypothetical protein